MFEFFFKIRYFFHGLLVGSDGSIIRIRPLTGIAGDIIVLCLLTGAAGDVGVGGNEGTRGRGFEDLGAGACTGDIGLCAFRICAIGVCAIARGGAFGGEGDGGASRANLMSLHKASAIGRLPGAFAQQAAAIAQIPFVNWGASYSSGFCGRVPFMTCS
jgi:hypothetical protein